MGEERLLGTTYKDGDTIVKEGTESREMKVVTGNGDNEAVLSILNEGNIFGERELNMKLSNTLARLDGYPEELVELKEYLKAREEG